MISYKSKHFCWKVHQHSSKISKKTPQLNEIKRIHFLKGQTSLILAVNDHKDSQDTAANLGSRVDSRKQTICCIRQTGSKKGFETITVYSNFLMTSILQKRFAEQK